MYYSLFIKENDEWAEVLGSHDYAEVLEEAYQQYAPFAILPTDGTKASLVSALDSLNSKGITVCRTQLEENGCNATVPVAAFKYAPHAEHFCKSANGGPFVYTMEGAE